MELGYVRLRNKIKLAASLTEYTKQSARIKLADMAKTFDRLLEVYELTDRRTHTDASVYVLEKLMKRVKTFDQWIRVFQLTPTNGKLFRLMIDRMDKLATTFQHWHTIFKCFGTNSSYDRYKGRAFMTMIEKAETLDEWISLFFLFPNTYFSLSINGKDYREEDLKALRDSIIDHLAHKVETAEDLNKVLLYSEGQFQKRSLLKEKVCQKCANRILGGK